MTQKVATVRKMKARQETINLPQPNCDSDNKADNKRQAFINTNTRDVLKFRLASWEPPLAGPWRCIRPCSFDCHLASPHRAIDLERSHNFIKMHRQNFRWKQIFKNHSNILWTDKFLLFLLSRIHLAY